MSVEQANPEIIVVSAVEDYRRLAKERIAATDAVLEIGCATGLTTKALARTGAKVVAIDCSEEVLVKARAAVAGQGKVEIARGDWRDLAAMKELLPEPDVIFLDIGGTALLDNVALLLRQCLRAYRPRLLVVRSHELADVVSLVADYRVPTRPVLRRPPVAETDQAALAALLDLSHSERVGNRLFAVRKLRQIDDPAAQARLVELTNDPSKRVSHAANPKKRQSDLG